jgi:hypothetical protein
MAVYTIIITNLGHPECLAHPPKSFMAAVFLGSLVSFSGEPTPERIPLSL